ncbi:MAG: alpha/beta hydrolase [Chthoniobacterales bacterium]
MRRSLCGFFLLAILTAVNADAATHKTKVSDLIYAERGSHKMGLDLYYPKTAAPAKGYPLIICFHGGAWIMGNKAWFWDLVLRSLTKSGYVIASVDYRLSSEATYPAQFADACDATRWLIHHAGSLQLDPHRIGVSGVSAGGQIALLLAFTQGHHISGSAPLPANTIKAVCALYPVTNLRAIVPAEKHYDPNNLIAKLLGGPLSEHEALAREASPETYVGKNVPPLFLVHGDKDIIVPLSQSRNLAAAVWKSGAKCQFLIYSGHGHAFRLYSSTLNEVSRFFDRYLRSR